MKTPAKFFLKPLFIFLAGLILISLSSWLNSRFWQIILLPIFILTALILAYIASFLLRLFFRAGIYNGKYRQKLMEFARKSDVNLRQIYVKPGGGDYDGMAAGTFNNKSIFFSQNFLNTHSFEEIEAVFAHELGHHAGIYVSIHAIFIAAIVFVAGWLEVLLPPYPIHPLILLLIISFLSFLFVLFISRKSESQADSFAKTHLKNPETFASFLRGYVEENEREGLEIPKNPWYRFFYTHPWVYKRIAFFEGGE